MHKMTQFRKDSHQNSQYCLLPVTEETYKKYNIENYADQENVGIEEIILKNTKHITGNDMVLSLRNGTYSSGIKFCFAEDCGDNMEDIHLYGEEGESCRTGEIML